MNGYRAVASTGTTTPVTKTTSTSQDQSQTSATATDSDFSDLLQDQMSNLLEAKPVEKTLSEDDDPLELSNMVTQFGLDGWMPTSLSSFLDNVAEQQEASKTGEQKIAETVDSIDDNLFVDKEASWLDAVDALNPLQHIPLVSDYYQEMTGDEIGYMPKVVGDTLLSSLTGAGAVYGLATGLLDVGVNEATGQSTLDVVKSKVGDLLSSDDGTSSGQS